GGLETLGVNADFIGFDLRQASLTFRSFNCRGELAGSENGPSSYHCSPQHCAASESGSLVHLPVLSASTGGLPRFTLLRYAPCPSTCRFWSRPYPALLTARRCRTGALSADQLFLAASA